MQLVSSSSKPVSEIMLVEPAAEISTPARTDQDGTLARRFSDQLSEVRPGLRAFLATLLYDRGAIEDCFQDLSVTVWQKFEADWELDDFRRYAFRCARFKALSWLKKNKPKSLVFLDPEIAADVGDRVAALTAGYGSESERRLEALERCIDALPEVSQRVLLARYSRESGKALQKIVSELSRSLPTIYKQLERLRSGLKRCVEGRLKGGDE